MKIKEALIISSSNIRVHKLRSTLTTIGIILGVAAVIAMVTLGASFEAHFVSRFKGVFNPTFFEVAPGEVRVGVGRAGFFVADTPIFTKRDVEEISRIHYIKNVYPSGNVPLSPVDGVKFKGRTLVAPFARIRADAVGGGYFGPEGAVPLESGRGFASASEIVVGYGLAEMILKQENLTQISDALGKSITVKFADGKTVDFSIVGITKSMFGWGFDYTLFMDMSYYSEARKVPGKENEEIVYHSLGIAVKEIGDIKKAQDAVLSYLRTNSDAKKFLDRDSPELGFVILSEEELVEFVQAQVEQFGGFITSIGFISLLVGSVGIANMMLVSVKERTKEIGILKASGARKRDILQVFLLEACLVGVIGSLIGVAVGIGLGYLFTTYGFFGGMSLPLVYRLEWLPISVTIGFLVGILSGLYPAWKASKINPVEALRYE